MSVDMGAAVGPSYRLDGPLPLPRSYSLLQVAQEVPLDQLDDKHWLSGAWLQTYSTDLATVHDPCAAGTFALKPDGGALSLPKFAAFPVVLPLTCFAGQVGDDPYAWFIPHLTPQLRVEESRAVELVLATGGGISIFGQTNPHLTDANLDKLDGGAAVSALHGLELLEDAIAATGRGGIIHATPATVTAWSQYGNLIEREDRDQLLYTVAKRTPIVVGDGYLGVFPDGGAAPGARQAWAFATGMVRYMADPPTGAPPLIYPDEYRQALNTADNVVTYRAERNYLITFDSDTTSGVNPPLQAGVLIDRSLATP